MDQERIQESFREILVAMGEDPDREGLLETPARVARSYAEIFAGLGKTAEEHLSKTFNVVNDDMVVEKNIPFYSMCEHHFLPFYGKIHLAYLPDGKVAGLSKLVRTCEVYARRPQLQEQLTQQIADALYEYLDCRGSLVIVEAEHLCMNMRGIKKPGASTVTSYATGEFLEDKELRDEAMRLMGL